MQDYQRDNDIYFQNNIKKQINVGKTIRFSKLKQLVQAYTVASRFLRDKTGYICMQITPYITFI
jgi:hypothetical protein